MSTSPSSVTRAQATIGSYQAAIESSDASTHSTQAREIKKPPYQQERLVEFLQLKAEIESLLEHLQSMKQQNSELSEELAVTKRL
ncbi:MAG: hypothetical protein N4J56_002926 [Chroococcidiopsis sp. SAG 2025]|uniref:hypothetical protein n=1 Tax=Chroococcidiopsis sp. SAG 2025 TaxID=171389 RepID=UPI002937236A|nr:hypothetical protein [Chroococcidiopsis sp. SAG 2025]MDV2993272.1 hypothetical protein [Chroococcidiopsis sp. SAG 2025]